MIKLFGALLILISGSSIGWILGSIYNNRVKELKELQLALSIFDTEISYGRTLLPEALKKSVDTLSSPLSRIFMEASEELNKANNHNFYDIWQEKINKNIKNSYLNREDFEILLNWGRQIGNSTLDDQLKINKQAVKRLEQHEEIARKIASKRVKPVRYAGVLISLMVIILFY